MTFTELFLLYLFTRLNTFIEFALVILVLGCIAIGMFTALIYSGPEWQRKKLKLDGRLKRAYIVTTLACLCVTLIPAQKDVMIIFAGSAVVQAARSETGKRIAGKSVEVIEQFLERQLNVPANKEK